MACYEQNNTPRTCSICAREILRGEKMMDFFRESSAKGTGEKVEWCHLLCVELAIERWIRKRREANKQIKENLDGHTRPKTDA